MDWWNNLTTIATSSGVTGGTAFAALVFMLSRNILWTNGAVKQLQVTAAEARLTELASKDAIIENLRTELKTMETDRNYYRTATQNQRDRADALSDKMIGEVVPLIRVSNEVLKSLQPQGKAGK